MGGESEAAWRAVLDDLVKRGLEKPELAIVDGAPGLEKALASLWSDLLLQRCTVLKLPEIAIGKFPPHLRRHPHLIHDSP